MLTEQAMAPPATVHQRLILLLIICFHPSTRLLTASCVHMNGRCNGLHAAATVSLNVTAPHPCPIRSPDALCGDIDLVARNQRPPMAARRDRCIDGRDQAEIGL